MRSLMLFIVTSFVASCTQPPQEMSTWEPDTVESEVREMFEAYHKAVLESGLTGEFEFLDSTDQFFWVPPGYESALKYDSVRSILESSDPGFNQVDFGWAALEVFPLSDSIATYSGIVTAQMTDTAGEVHSTNIIESGTVIRRVDGWKLLCGQSASLE